MNEKLKTSISKLLSLVLRHNPESIGIQLDENGWVAVADLLTQLKAHNKAITFSELEEIVATNNKQRFAFNDDHSCIRANQGHSIEVDMNFEAKQPPHVLYHGTVGDALEAIAAGGLQKMGRQHVHLSADITTAEKVGMRRGKPVILTINSGAMFNNGCVFYQSENGVWLTDNVPVHYINFPNHEQ